jgi:hypothetical protein
MRGLAFTALFLSLATGPVSANDTPQVSDSVKVQLPSELIARLPAPQQKPGDMRRAYLKSLEKRAK